MSTSAQHGSASGGGSGSSSQSTGAAGKKRRSNVSKACENCRRRRVKCDGVKPSCGTCAVYKVHSPCASPWTKLTSQDECYWEAREDYRKPPSRSQVEALATRVKDLERLLRQHGVDPGEGLGEAGSGYERYLRKEKPQTVEESEQEHEQTENDPHDPRDWTLDHLVEREEGDLHLHGPTSAFRHLGRFPTERVGPLDMYPENQASMQLPIGYARHLPATVSLSQYEHDHCIELFFKFLASWCLRTNPILFRQEMEIHTQPPFPRVPNYSPLLHNAILSIALGYSDDPHLRTQAVRKQFSDQAKSYIDEEGLAPSIATVQGLAHLAAYHSLSAEHNLGWLYIGMSLRCAMALGLNTSAQKLLEKGQITADQARARNVTFWTAVLQEGLWAPYIGRSIYIPDFTTSLPEIDHDLDQYPWEGSPWGLVRTQPSMLSTAFVETVKLMQIGNKLFSNLYGLKADMLSLNQTGIISEISLALASWHESLPPSLTLNFISPKNALPHILMMHLSHAWLVILLHRPFYRPLIHVPGLADGSSAAASRAASAVKQCDRAASHVIQMLQIWHRVHDLRFTPPTTLQVCFVAGTTHLLSLASSRTSSKKHTEAAANVDECVRLLGLMGVTWPAAEQAKLLLDGLRADYGLSNGSNTFAKPLSGAGVKVDPSEASPLHEQPSVGINIGPADPSTHNHNNSNLQPYHRGSEGPIGGSGPPMSAPLPIDFSSAFSATDFNLGTNIPMSNPFPTQPLPTTNPTTTTNTNTTNTTSAGTDTTANWLSTSMESSTDWHLDWGNEQQSQLDRETQALIDTILQPHLSVGFPLQQNWDDQYRNF